MNPKEYLMTFSDDMIKAILNGHKTMTRRVVKLQPLSGQMIGQSYKLGDRLRVHTEYISARVVYIILEIVNIEVERLQDISEEDAKAEGIFYHDGLGVGHSGWRYSDYGYIYDTAKQAFRELWNSIYGLDNPKSWEANLWVWAITFRVVK